CCCQRFPGPSRNFLLGRWQAKPEGRLLSPRPSSFSMKNKSTSQSPKAFSLPLISPPPSSLSFSGKGYAPYLNVGRHSGILLFWPWVNIGSNMIGGPSYAMRSIKKSKPPGSCRDYKKRVLSCVALKKGQRRRRSLTYFLPPAPA
ncbi:LOW QUALITY PROTEIN: hypothetical protein CFC21_023252, partial [Triticum aestivum]